MKIACIEGEKIILKETSKPDVKESGALIKVSGCGLCGSDIVKFRQRLVSDGTVLGHEVVGEIVEINSKTDFKVGDKIVSSHHIPCFDCVYCRSENYSMCEHFKKTNIFPGGFSEYVYLTEEHLKNVVLRIPQNLTEIEASFYEPLGCCVRAIKRGNLAENSKVLVIGLGSIGILMGQALKAYGVDVYACDVIQDRIDFANNLGLKAFHSATITDEILIQTQNLGVDAVFMTAGVDVTIDLALKSVRSGGKIVVFASTPKNFGYANNEIYYRELTVMGSYSPSPDDLKESMRLLTNKEVKVKDISTIYDFGEIEKAFCDTISNAILKAYIRVNHEQ